MTKTTSPKKKQLDDESSVTQSEQSSYGSENSEEEIVVPMTGTQHVPERRNEGSLDLYSDHSEDNSAEADLNKYLTDKLNKSQATRVSPRRAAAVARRRV